MLSDRILFIDGDALVLNKPAGLPVDTPRIGGDSVERRLDELKCGFKRLPTPMHRLDQDTSGCLLFARNPRARTRLQLAFEERRVEKAYLAVVGAELPEEGGTISLSLAKRSSPEAGWRMVTDPQGQEAVTHWQRIAVREGRTLVEFRPVTGRTHQIRVHARAAFGTGIAGDRIYGFPGGPMLLHASKLLVPREGKATIDSSAPLPEHWPAEWHSFDTLRTGDAG